MAKYTQLTADLARKALDAKVARDLLIALEYVALAERIDSPYGEVRRSFERLERAGITLDLDDLIGPLLADRARANRKRRKDEGLGELRHGTKANGTKLREVESEEKRNAKAKRNSDGDGTDEYELFASMARKVIG